MHPNAMLDQAVDLVRAVLKFDAPLETVLSEHFRRRRELGVRERQVLADTAYALVRHRLRWQHLAQTGTGALERRLAILAWQGDRSWLHRAVGPNENAWWQGTNAVDLASLPDKLHHNLPDWLAGALRASLPADEFMPLARALDAQAPLDLRVNVLKAKRAQVQAALAEAGIASEPTPHSPWGLRVAGKPSLAHVACYERGEVEVQDEGSQLLALLVDPRRGEMVADFCAGAGGKTLALGAAMRNTGRLYAFDVSGHRLDALKPRLARSGLSNVYPAQIAHERDDRIRRLAGKLNRVLVDAPCTGLGTLRRHPDLKWRQSPQTVAAARDLQQRILASAAQLVAPGGRLVYATCSLLRAENEDVVAAFEAGDAGLDFGRLPAAQVLAEARVEGAAGLDDAGCMRLWPHRHHTDGFFAAVWQRR
jgi:16S rRNA (cytosine967-C5)-methyltransferase